MVKSPALWVCVCMVGILHLCMLWIIYPVWRSLTLLLGWWFASLCYQHNQYSGFDKWGWCWTACVTPVTPPVLYSICTQPGPKPGKRRRKGKVGESFHRH